jgi:Fe/S biogenesis protein NfuA
MSSQTEHPIVTVTEAARTAVLEMRAAETDAESLALRVEISGTSTDGREFAYDLMFEPVAEHAPEDQLRHEGDLPIVVPAASVADLQGAILDHTGPTGLVIRNPNRPSMAAGPQTVVLEGSVEEKLVQLLDGEINPSLAAHGGYATLQGVKDDIAYITMGGGCQGCGLASLTLAEGIKAQIEERIPEIKEVVDVTNHAEGENPFYSASH